MKTLVLLAVLSLGLLQLSAQDYKLKKAVIANGGAISATTPGGSYKHSSTVGQIATERKNGGLFHEGFWTKIPLTTDVEVPNPEGDPIISNYPNPFSTNTTISYRLDMDAQVTLRIYDINGQLISILVDEFQGTGEKTVSWEAKDATGADVASGSYLYELQVRPSSGKSFSLRNIMVVSK